MLLMHFRRETALAVARRARLLVPDQRGAEASERRRVDLVERNVPEHEVEHAS
jgi:hypothetical protein